MINVNHTTLFIRSNAATTPVAPAMKIIDGIIPEPVGGAHRDTEGVIKAAGDVIVKAITEFDGRSADEIRKDRREKFLAMGRAG